LGNIGSNSPAAAAAAAAAMNFPAAPVLIWDGTVGFAL